MQTHLKLLAAFAILTLCAANPDSRVEVIDYPYLVSGKTVVFVDFAAPPVTDCASATGSDATLKQLTRRGVAGHARFTLERLASPVFPPAAGAGEIGSDRYAFVRGQKVSPECSGGRFYWIRNVENQADAH
jgi:hypothetical protein